MQKIIEKVHSAILLIWDRAKEYLLLDIREFLSNLTHKSIYEIEYNKGIESYNNKDYQASVKYYKRAIKLNPSRTEAYYNLGLAYFELNNSKGAELNFRKVVQLDSLDMDAYYNLGLLLQKEGRFEDALNQFYTAIELKNTDPDNFYSAGLVFADMNKFSEASVYIGKALEFSPDSVEYAFGLALVNDKKCDITGDPEDINEAINAYQNALNLDPKNEEGNYRLAICYAKKGLWDECVEYCKKVLEINDKSALAYNQYGLALYCKEDIDNSIIMFRKALVIQPDFAIAYHHLGNSFEKQGDFKTAIAHFNKYLELDPKNKDVSLIKAHIKALDAIMQLKS